MSLKRKNCLFLIPFLHTFQRSPSRMNIRPGTSNTWYGGGGRGERPGQGAGGREETA
jgi:hypothetical protein